MSDDLVKKLREKPWRGGSESNDEAQIRRQKEREDGADLIEAQAAEIMRLRAACDAYFKTISLSQMRHGRILVGLERRNARQRRALAKLYKRRHEKNVALATAKREGMEDAAQKALIIASVLSSPSAQNALRSFADAIRAAAQEGK